MDECKPRYKMYSENPKSIGVLIKEEFKEHELKPHKQILDAFFKEYESEVEKFLQSYSGYSFKGILPSVVGKLFLYNNDRISSFEGDLQYQSQEMINYVSNKNTSISDPCLWIAHFAKDWRDYQTVLYDYVLDTDLKISYRYFSDPLRRMLN